VHQGLKIAPRPAPEMKEFLLAQLQWEQYRASRLVLVHILAVSGLLWIPTQLFTWVPLPNWMRTAIAAACAGCFLCSLFAGMMEWRWGRERDRRAGVLPSRWSSD
jgi:hypothetical protein